MRDVSDLADLMREKGIGRIVLSSEGDILEMVLGEAPRVTPIDSEDEQTTEDARAEAERVLFAASDGLVRWNGTLPPEDRVR